MKAYTGGYSSAFLIGDLLASVGSSWRGSLGTEPAAARSTCLTRAL